MGRKSLAANDVLDDIEFELIQGAIPRNELGESIQIVKQYQNKIRNEFFRSTKPKGSVRKLANYLFQINDILITLLQEVTSALRATQLELRRMVQMSKFATKMKEDANLDSAIIEPPIWEMLDRETPWQSSTEIEEVMRPEALHIELDVRSTRMPIIGGLLKRLRIALHSLTLFYTNRLASKQEEVNRIYGDWILHLSQLLQYQQEQIESLRNQVIELQVRLEGTEQSSARTTKNN